MRGTEGEVFFVLTWAIEWPTLIKRRSDIGHGPGLPSCSPDSNADVSGDSVQSTGVCAGEKRRGRVCSMQGCG